MNTPADLVAQWYRAFAAGDIEGVVSLYARDAVFIGTTSTRATQSPADVRAYFQRVMLEWKPAQAVALECSVQELGADVAAATVFDKVAWVEGAGPPPSFGRVSLVLRRQDGAWRIAHFHRSAVPQA